MFCTENLRGIFIKYSARRLCGTAFCIVRRNSVKIRRFPGFGSVGPPGGPYGTGSDKSTMATNNRQSIAPLRLETVTNTGRERSAFPVVNFCDVKLCKIIDFVDSLRQNRRFLLLKKSTIKWAENWYMASPRCLKSVICFASSVYISRTLGKNCQNGSSSATGMCTLVVFALDFSSLDDVMRKLQGVRLECKCAWILWRFLVDLSEPDP